MLLIWRMFLYIHDKFVSIDLSGSFQIRQHSVYRPLVPSSSGMLQLNKNVQQYNYQICWHKTQLLIYEMLQAVDKTGYNLPKSVQEIMDRWVLQMGFPVVTINTTSGEITQEHFLLDPTTKPDKPSEFKYVNKIFWEK